MESVTFDPLSEQSDSGELNGLLGPSSEQALNDEPIDLAANPIQFSEQLETDQPIDQMLFGSKSLAGKIPEPPNLDLPVALTSDSNPLFDMATEPSAGDQLNPPMFDLFEQPPDTKPEKQKRMVDP